MSEPRKYVVEKIRTKTNHRGVTVFQVTVEQTSPGLGVMPSSDVERITSEIVNTIEK